MYTCTHVYICSDPPPDLYFVVFSCPKLMPRAGETIDFAEMRVSCRTYTYFYDV